MNSTAPPIVGYVDYARYHSGIGWALTMLDYVMLCASVRYDNAVPGDARRYARMHPLSSFVGSMTLCFGGVAFCSQCLRDGGLLDELNDRVMVTAIFVWYLVNYCPYDLVYTVLRNRKVCVTMVILREACRLRQLDEYVNIGMQHIGSSYESFGVCVFILAMVRVKTPSLLRRALRRASPEEVDSNAPSVSPKEMFRPAPSTKFYIVGSLLLLIQRDTSLAVEFETLYVLLGVAFISRRLVNMRGGFAYLRRARGRYSQLEFLGYEDMNELNNDNDKGDCNEEKDNKKNQ